MWYLHKLLRITVLHRSVVACVDCSISCSYYISCASYNESADKLLLQPKSVSVSRFYVIATYALNPLTVASCVSMSMSVFHNLIMSTMFLCMIKGMLSNLLCGISQTYLLVRTNSV
jgi:GPI transamidase subunit PIG-U